VFEELAEHLRRNLPKVPVMTSPEVKPGWLVLHVSMHGTQRADTYRVEFEEEPDGNQVMEMLADAKSDGLVLFGQKWDFAKVHWSAAAYIWIPAHNIRMVVGNWQEDMESDGGGGDAEQPE
jgi:hypothetical protein